MHHLDVVMWFVPSLVALIATKHSLLKRGKRTLLSLVVWNGLALGVIGALQQVTHAKGPLWVEECFQLAPNPWGQLGVTTKSERYGSGRFITTHILPYLEKLGTEILTETEATALLRDPGKRPETFMDLRELRKEIRETCSRTYTP